MKRILLFSVIIFSLCQHSLAQSAKIVNAQAAGYIANMEAGNLSGLDLMVKVGVEYSKIGNDESSCVVLMNNTSLPVINTAKDLIEACQTLNFNGEDIPGTTNLHKETFNVSVPINPERVNGQEKMFYVQAFVMYDESNPRLIAKSEVIKVDAEKLTVLETRLPQEEMQQYRNIISGAFNMGKRVMVDALEGRAANGQIRCNMCDGNGRVIKGGAEKFVGKCDKCNGTGLMDDPTGDNHSSLDAPSDFMDIYGKAQKLRMKQNQKNNSSRQNR